MNYINMDKTRIQACFFFCRIMFLKMVKNGGLCFDLNSYRFETASSHYLNLKPANVSWTCDIISVTHVKCVDYLKNNMSKHFGNMHYTANN